MKDIFWLEDDQQFYTIPDGDKATELEIKEYYDSKLNEVENSVRRNNI